MYNAEPYIRSCLDSILHQGLDPEIYEIIVINDGSKDKSVEIVREYTKYTNIFLLSQENQGQSVARNYGISKAKGKYVQFVDSDDFLIPNSLLQIVNFAQNVANDTIDIITFGISEGDFNKKDVNEGSGACLFIGDGYEYIASHNYNNSPCYYWINLDYINKCQLRFQSGKLCEDGMFTLTALLNANSIADIDSRVYYYVMRQNSTTSTMNLERRKKIIDGFIYTIDFFEKMINTHENMNASCRERVLERRDSYVFFLLARLLRMGDSNLAKKVTLDLKEKGIYPIKNFPGRDYPGMKYKVIKQIFNVNPLYSLFCKLYGFKLRNEK